MTSIIKCEPLIFSIFRLNNISLRNNYLNSNVVLRSIVAIVSNIFCKEVMFTYNAYLGSTVQPFKLTTFNFRKCDFRKCLVVLSVNCNFLTEFLCINGNLYLSCCSLIVTCCCKLDYYCVNVLTINLFSCYTVNLEGELSRFAMRSYRIDEVLKNITVLVINNSLIGSSDACVCLCNINGYRDFKRFIVHQIVRCEYCYECLLACITNGCFVCIPSPCTKIAGRKLELGNAITVCCILLCL